MRCLSIRPPWSLVVADGRKTLENRPRPTQIRGEVLIHSSLRYDVDAEDFIRVACSKMHMAAPSIEALRAAPRGALVGVMTIVDCLTYVEVPPELRPWRMGPYCYVITNARAFPKPIPWRGSLGFFHVPDDAVTLALKASRRR